MPPGDGDSGHGSTEERSYRWRCPFCGESQVGLAAREDPEAEAVNQLLAHVRSTAGAGHGAADTLPDDAALEEPTDLVSTSSTDI